MSSIKITKSAEEYLVELLKKQGKDTIGIKVFVTEAGSPRAETCIAYCKGDEELSEFRNFVILFFGVDAPHALS